MELDHVVDLPPSVLAYPFAVETRDILRVTIAVGRRTNPVVLILPANYIFWPIVAAHDAHVTVGPSQLKGVGHFVPVVLTESEDRSVSTGSVTSLVVVVVDEDEGIQRSQLTPILSEIIEVGELITVVPSENVSKIFTVFELGHPADERVLAGSDGFSAHVDDLLVDVGSRAGREPLGVEVGELVDDGVDVIGEHVFGGVKTEASHTPIDQLVEEAGDRASNVRLFSSQVPKSGQTAISNLVGVIVILDFPVGSETDVTSMEIPRTPRHLWVGESVGIPPVSGRSVSVATACHVIHHSVHVDAEGFNSMFHFNTVLLFVMHGSIVFNTIFVSSHMYPENPEGTQVIVGSMNMGYISNTARNRTHNLFRPKRESIPLGHSDGQATVTIDI